MQPPNGFCAGCELYKLGAKLHGGLGETLQEVDPTNLGVTIDDDLCPVRDPMRQVSSPYVLTAGNRFGELSFCQRRASLVQGPCQLGIRREVRFVGGYRIGSHRAGAKTTKRATLYSAAAVTLARAGVSLADVGRALGAEAGLLVEKRRSVRPVELVGMGVLPSLTDRI